MDDKLKKLLAGIGIAAIIGGIGAKLGYDKGVDKGKYLNRPKAVVTRELNNDNGPDQVVLTYSGQRYIFMNKGEKNLRLDDYIALEKDNIIKQTQDIK
jgi:hypothetical protein